MWMMLKYDFFYAFLNSVINEWFSHDLLALKRGLLSIKKALFSILENKA
jgi:hypothetical protein